MADLDQAIRSKPQSIWYIERAEIWRKKGRVDDALIDLTAAIQLDPHSALAFSDRGNIWRLKGSLDKALEDHDQAVRLAPRNSGFLALRGYDWQLKKELDRALADYTEAIQLDSRNAAFYKLRGAVFREKRDFSRALEDLEQAVRLNPQDANAYFERGILWGAQERFDPALDDLDRELQLNPNSTEAYNEVARIRATASDPKYRDGMKAVEAARKAYELGQWKVAAHLDTLAAAYAAAGDFAEAVKWQTKAIDVLRGQAGTGVQVEAAQRQLELYKSGRPLERQLQ